MKSEQHHARRAKTWILTVLILFTIVASIHSWTFVNPQNGQSFANSVQANSGSSDYSLWVQPYLSNIEQLRAYLMQPPNPNQSPKPKIGVNPVYGLVQGDYVCGGYQPLGSSLNNNDLMAGKGLDYLNSLKGINSTIEANTRMYLAMQWNNVQPSGWACTAIMTQSSWTYQCTDKHELLFGKASPCYQTIMSSCATAAGNEAFITTYSGIQMVVESGVGGNCLSGNGHLNDLAPYVNYLWLKGDTTSIQQAVQIFDATLSNWTPTPGTGLGGTTGGCFSSPYGPNPSAGAVARTRDLGFWLNMARATGLWNSSSLAMTVTQEVVNQIWGQQKSDGSIAVDYPNSSPAPCGGSSSTYPKDSGESDGLTIAAFDVRLPGWFGTGSGLAPLLNVPSTETVNTGSALDLTITASDPGGYAVNIAVTGLPKGASFDSQKGTFSWTPAGNQTGTYSIDFLATDNASPPMTTAKTMTVQVNKSGSGCTICLPILSLLTGSWSILMLILGALAAFIVVAGVLTRRARNRLKQAKAKSTSLSEISFDTNADRGTNDRNGPYYTNQISNPSGI